jgi:6-phosphogluconolactonase
MAGSTLRVLKDIGAVARAAAELFVKLAAQAQAERKPFRVVLSGGTTPKALYDALASREFRSRVQWDGIAFFFGDERAVPPGHPDSNYRTANDHLFRPLSISDGQVHRMKADTADLEAAATAYEQDLRAAFGGLLPQFDLSLLGMGPDGHTASLFPRTKALGEQQRWVVPVTDAPKPLPRRLTLTVPVLNSARQILFMVTGKDKAEALREVLEGTASPQQYPAKLVNPGPPRLTWLVDDAAASGLTDYPSHKGLLP